MSTQLDQDTIDIVWESLTDAVYRNDGQATGTDTARYLIEALAERGIVLTCWQAADTEPRDVTGSYLVTNAKGHVAPCVRGIIQNNVGTVWDWEYGEKVTHWMPLPVPPAHARCCRRVRRRRGNAQQEVPMNQFATAALARRFELAAARGRSYEARLRRSDLRTAIDDAVRALDALRAVGVDRNYLDDTVAGLIDAVTNVDADCLKEIDNGNDRADDLDLSGVHGLLAKVRKP